MLLLIGLALLGHVASVPLSGSSVITPTNEEYAARYVLPNNTYPVRYDVSLFIDPGQTSNFTGEVIITILAAQETDEIVIHAMEMSIESIQVYSERNSTENLFQNFTLATDDTHFLRIRLSAPILPLQPHNVHIRYVSNYASNMFGVYVSTYEEPGRGTINLVTSQLQPTFARRAFPCYDEPALKAVFTTTIYAPPAYPVVRSNMPLRNDTSKPEVPGYVKHEFQDTLTMSTYLLAYLVSEFDYVENSDNQIYDVPFRVYSRPGTRNTTYFALDFGQRNMLALENYTEFRYAFPKIDKAAVPDFAAGAMENWGLVIYREVALLVQDGVTTTATRQNIGRIICHENVHMWFGNEVGPWSWTYTWLNEGFANFFESFGTELVLPGWRMMDQFVITMQSTFQSDAVLSINPMTHPVFTPSQIIGTFNAIAYQKSGSVIRMMQHILTPEVFRRGLVIYIQRHSRSAARPADLYAALQTALVESGRTLPYTVSTILDRWTNQGGFPILTVRRTAPSSNSVFISQERYFTDTTLNSTDRWHVPVNWVLSSNVNFGDTSPQAWVPPSFPAPAVDIPGLANAEWYIFNKQQTGYYRVNYDVENWQALARVLNSSHQTIHLLNRAQIIDDSFNVARTGRLNYNYPLEISRYLVLERDYIPWAAANAAFNYLDIVMAGSSVYDLFQQYLLELSAPLYAQLGFVPQSGEEFVTPYHRNIILNLHCRYGNPDCIGNASQMLQNFRNNPSQRIDPDLQNTIYCSGLRGGDVDNYNFLWGLYLASTDSSEQSVLLNALGCTSNEELRTAYLNQMIVPNSQVREQDRHTILVSIINSSPENMEAALDFTIEHFPTIQQNVQGLTGTTNILNAFARRLHTQAHMAKIDDFVQRHNSIFSAGELASIGAIRENIAASINWSTSNLAVVEAWLRNNYGNNANIISSSALIIVSIVLAIYNY